MIPDSVLKEIQDRLDIVEVVGSYLSLKKSGRNFKGLCPFHPEKTPSFMIYPEKQFFICYGCGAGGDLIAFVMRKDGLDFQEAVLGLAERSGVSVQWSQGSKRKTDPELIRAHEVATRFYQENLMKGKEAEEARAYLKQRGIQESTWETFSLGFAPARWDDWLSYAKGQNLSPELLEKAGLVVPRQGQSGWYDRFRNRIIFPVWDPRGRVIAFGGRTLEKGEPAKYLNSPETPLFVKGKVLYGLHLSSPHIRARDFCIVVEGYLDMMTPFQHGIQNVVASMGTSLTPEQVQLIRRLTHHVVMVYDGDYAGEAATLRGLDLFLEAQMRVKVAVLPPGTDPDSLIRDKGIETFAKAIQQSQDLFDYKLGLLLRQFDPKTLEGRIRISEEMLPTIRKVSNAIGRGEYIRRLSQALGVEESLLWKEFEKTKGGNLSRQMQAAVVPPSHSITPEDGLAGLLLDKPSRIADLEGRLDIEKLKDPEIQRLVLWLQKQWKAGGLPEDHRGLFNTLSTGSPEMKARMVRWLAWAASVEEEEKEHTLEEILERIDEGYHRASLESLQDLIRRSEQAGDEGTTAELVIEYNRLLKGHVVRTAKS